MMSYVYSAKNNAFFYKPELHLYKKVGWDLSDIIDVSYDLFLEFTQDRNEEGVMRVAGDDGLPSWEKLPPPTYEELVATSDLQKQRLIYQANEYMNSKQWPGKAAMGRLSDTEKTQYNLWLDYLDALEAVDTFSASDINWPVPPEV
ncbi:MULTISPECIES: tail fiber assembly protein [Enterobacteriaceae]|uniref:tail fiber assembly protein n=1 Tax=Enterobacteriaceae TaxID=543 RepID=UPI00201CCD76|nr:MULTISPECIES: tail fiber assembly protein [Enterobacteriaceae]